MYDKKETGLSDSSVDHARRSTVDHSPRTKSIQRGSLCPARPPELFHMYWEEALWTSHIPHISERKFFLKKIKKKTKIHLHTYTKRRRQKRKANPENRELGSNLRDKRKNIYHSVRRIELSKKKR